MNWIQLLQEETDKAETPRSFIFWGAISTISAIASPNVWMNNKGVYQTRPNTYTLLMARSGFGKAFAPNISRKMVRLVKNTRVIAGRSTIEGILKEAASAYTIEGTTDVIKDSRAYIVSGEFATSLQRNPDALTILTDLYDTNMQDDWKNTLKTSPVEVLRNPCITLFSASSPEHFSDFIPKVNIYGGFIGRTLLVYADKRHRINSLISYEDEQDEPELPWDKLIEHLLKIKDVKGQFYFTKKAGALYNEWYHGFRDVEFLDKTGTAERLQEHVKKVAMCISLAKKLDLRIELEDIRESIAVVTEVLGGTKRITSGAGKSEIADKMHAALTLILSAPEGQISREELLVKGYGDFDVTELDRIIETLIQTKFLQQTGTAGKPVYKVTETGKNLWSKISHDRRNQTN